ncbi:MAG: hypothetical protein HY512_01450 [Candidatus Aenigmarchaeota archaeon]|nr:hypothetical protein [Candidatus Aenigmarchaeota archaeon]
MSGIEESTIVGKTTALKGFLAGGLFLISFFISIDMFFKTLIFFYGIIALLDGLIPSKQEEYYPISLFAGILIGFVLSIVFYHYFGLNYVYLIIAVATVTYVYRAVLKIKS